MNIVVTRKFFKTNILTKIRLLVTYGYLQLNAYTVHKIDLVIYVELQK